MNDNIKDKNIGEKSINRTKTRQIINHLQKQQQWNKNGICGCSQCWWDVSLCSALLSYYYCYDWKVFILFTLGCWTPISKLAVYSNTRNSIFKMRQWKMTLQNVKREKIQNQILEKYNIT